MDCYPITIGKDFLPWVIAVTSNEAKMLILKMGLPSLRVYYVWFYPLPTGKVFCIVQLM